MIEKFIRASAGTGKTHTLLNTIFAYNEKKKPTADYQTACERINKSVFLTFSNSAAEEIRSRIYKGLSQCNGRPEMDLTRALAQEDVRIRVYTIHSFALEMLRLFRYKLGLPAELSFAEEDEPLWDYCVEEFFAKNWNQKALAELLNISSSDKTTRALLEVFLSLSDTKKIKEFITKKGATLYFLSAMGKSFCFDVPTHLAEVETLLKNNLGIDVSADYSEALLTARNTLATVKDKGLYKETEQTWKDKIAKKQEDLAKKEQKQAELEEKEKLKGLTAKQEEDLAKIKKDIEKFKQEIDKLQKELKKYLADKNFLLNVCPVLDTCSYFIEQILLVIGNQLYMPRMLSNGIFDFDAVVFLFIKELLRGNSTGQVNVNDFLKELENENQSFDSLYIDEAQDNDIIQNYLVILFGQGACPVKVYVVGDLKQSIYNWRSAYPREFEKMMEECKKKGDISQTLKTSYRLKAQNTCASINRICTAVNEIYSGAWWYDPSEDDLEIPAGIQATNDGQVEMWWANGEKMELSAGNGEEQPDYIEELRKFFQRGKTAVAVRARKQIAAVPDLKEYLEKANYKIEREIAKSEEEQSKEKTLLPELELVLLLFMALTDETVEQVPFALFWSSAGRLLAQLIELGGNPMEADFKAIFEKISDDISKDIAGNRVERVLNLFDQYKLWNCLYHDGLKEEEISPQELRRIFYHILMRARLAEDKYNCREKNTFYADPVLSIIKQGKIARSCYSLPEWAAVYEETENAAPDVITIHGSKGRAYDNMIVVADFKNDFFGNTEDFSKYSTAYSQLFSVRFKEILGEEPQIDVSYFPYLGNIPAHLIKNKEIADTEFWKKLQDSYGDIEKLNRSEKLNLLYVALTRTAKNLLLLDVGKGKKEKNGQLKPEVQEIYDLFTAAGVAVHEVRGENPTDLPAQSVKYQYHEVEFSPMDIAGRMKTRSVRSEITGKIYRKYGGKLSCLERFNHAKKGSMVHNVMQRIISRACDVNDFMSQAETLRQHTPADNSLYAQAVQLVAKNQKAIEGTADLLGKYTFYHEVPVWQFDKDSQTLVKGSIDTLAVSEKQSIIVEYKVKFQNGHDQQALAAEQTDRYKRMLRALGEDNTLKTRIIELSE